MLSLNAKDYFDSRDHERLTFLKAHVAGGYSLSTLAEDWASRRYFRVTKENGDTAVLMEAVPDHTGAFTPGHKVSDFVRIAKALRGMDVHSPSIIAADEHEGYVLLEDFGDMSVYDVVKKGGDAPELYAKATDVLISLRQNMKTNALDLPDYYDGHIHAAKLRLVDWYVPATRQAKNPDGLAQSYLAAWREVEQSLPPCPMGFVHGDFHLQNLMLLDNGTLGVLDFQGAMWGPTPYDLANLLEDIRRDVPADLYEAMLARYDDRAEFRQWFRVLATQFHCRILGQVLRLAIAGNRISMLQYIPRVQNYMAKGLKDPVLAPVARWFKEERVDLAAKDCFDPDKMREFIRPDAV